MYYRQFAIYHVSGTNEETLTGFDVMAVRQNQCNDGPSIWGQRSMNIGQYLMWISTSIQDIQTWDQINVLHFIQSIDDTEM